MPKVPPCRSLGRQCLQLEVVLHVADLDDDTPAEQDALATWLTGHTERLSFGTPFREGSALLVNAVIRVPCKHLVDGDEDAWAGGRVGGREGISAHRPARPTARCLAHGFEGPLPTTRPAGPAPSIRQHRPDDFLIVHSGKRRVMELQTKPLPPRSLPVMGTDNPCVGAPCRTADNASGAACCRDLTIDVVLEGERPGLLELLRSRRSPYLCKVTPGGNGMAECEVISTCGYLETDGVTCALHDRVRPGGESAKPFVCSQWPELGPDQAGHPGCRLL